MAQGQGLPKMTQSGGGYPAAHVKGAMNSMAGKGGVPIKNRDYKTATPTYMNTALTHQGVKMSSGK